MICANGMPPGSPRSGYAVPAGSPSVEETKTRTRCSGVKITAARSARDSLPGEAITPACSGSPIPPALLAAELGNGTRW
jgi:hypothetical protein